ncbi:Crp/Fnr family transcriptional regulator [uncultured Thiodictyon sp.]|jgi:CRP-like cAMP-binding protein|uniref:Crp/Fnr family transcriptional regulator n=1 Tax=uncultured Thiodictyon sp. TaxID=1846217 RepID=UPI0025D5A743|nr:Crp/Fnr family transcriptional regulator [uncultured Thiodictyon sp.]
MTGYQCANDAPPSASPGSNPAQPVPKVADELSLLRDMPIFGAVPDQALAYLNARAERVAMPAGHWFFHQGDRGETMYVLRFGRVEIHRALGERAEVIGRLGPGDCFGEMALIDLYPRSAGVRAAEDCLALGLSNALLYQLYAVDPEPFTLIMMNLARELSRRLRRTEAMLFKHAGPPPRPERHPTGTFSEIPYV